MEKDTCDTLRGFRLLKKVAVGKTRFIQVTVSSFQLLLSQKRPNQTLSIEKYIYIFPLPTVGKGFLYCSSASIGLCPRGIRSKRGNALVDDMHTGIGGKWRCSCRYYPHRSTRLQKANAESVAP